MLDREIHQTSSTLLLISRPVPKFHSFWNEYPEAAFVHWSFVAYRFLQRSCLYKKQKLHCIDLHRLELAILAENNHIVTFLSTKKSRATFKPGKELRTKIHFFFFLSLHLLLQYTLFSLEQCNIHSHCLGCTTSTAAQLQTAALIKRMQHNNNA